MSASDRDDLSLDTRLIADVDHLIQPLKRLLSPVSLGVERIPREGSVLLTGNHTIYGMLDIPMLVFGVFEKTGRMPRGLGDHNHFAVPVSRYLLQRMGAVRGTREICARLFARLG